MALCEWAWQLLDSYRQHKQGRRSVAAARKLRDDAAVETYRDLKALLKLLHSFTQGDWLDLRESTGHPPSKGVDVPQVGRNLRGPSDSFKLPVTGRGWG